jgi:pentatricopeptide repeat protein
VSYRTKIDVRICWVASENMDVLLIRSQRNIINRNFLTALSLLDSAFLITTKYPDCSLDSDKLHDTIIKYLPAKQYQEMMIKLDGYVSLELFSGFVNQYLEAGKFHERNSLRQFGLVYLPLFDYVTEKSKEQFTLSVINYYLNNKDVAEAFRYLKLLKKQGYPSNTAKELLKSIGQKMASKDHRSEPLKDPSVFIEQYTNGDKWFANFEVSYMKEWNRLKNEGR